MAEIRKWENKEPPTDREAESAFLGACLLTEAAIIAGIEAGLQPHHFYIEAGGALWRAIQKRFAANLPTDIVLIHPDAAAEHPHWEGDKGEDQLIDIMTACPVAGFAPAYAKQIIETAEKRHAYTIAVKAAQDPENSAKILAEAQLPKPEPELEPYSRTLHYSDGDWAKKIVEDTWLIPDWMPLGQLIHLAATGGQGKSRLTLQLAAGLATGNPWLYRHNSARHIDIPRNYQDTQWRVHIATWEDNISTYAKRLKLMGYQDTGSRLSISEERDHLWTTESAYDNVGQASQSLTSLCQMAQDENLDLLIIDPTVAAYGADENNRQQVRAFLSRLQTLMDDMDGKISVMLVSHTPKDTAHIYSGSTDWLNAARSFWSLRTETMPKTDPPEKAVRLRLEKSNHSPPHPATDDIWLAGWPAWQATSKEAAIALYGYADLTSYDHQPPPERKDIDR